MCSVQIRPGPLVDLKEHRRSNMSINQNNGKRQGYREFGSSIAIELAYSLLIFISKFL